MCESDVSTLETQRTSLERVMLHLPTERTEMERRMYLAGVIDTKRELNVISEPVRNVLYMEFCF